MDFKIQVDNAAGSSSYLNAWLRRVQSDGVMFLIHSKPLQEKYINQIVIR